MAFGTRTKLFGLCAAALLAAPGAASADAIYGCWSLGAERLTVAVDHVVTPGGASPEAQIHRHGAAYVAPDGERDAGRRLEFRQLNEQEVARQAYEPGDGAAVGAREIWAPCGPAPVS